MLIRKMVAYNKEKNCFFGLEETFSTTNPIEVFHPYFAKLIDIDERQYFYASDRNREYHVADYFENSERMKKWLEGYELRTIEMEIEYNFIT